MSTKTFSDESSVFRRNPVKDVDLRLTNSSVTDETWGVMGSPRERPNPCGATAFKPKREPVV